MTRYWKYWRRGWWAFFFVLVVNFPAGIVIKALDATLVKGSAAYYVLMFTLFLFALIPFSGLVFEYFAAKSPRLRSAPESSRDSA